MKSVSFILILRCTLGSFLVSKSLWEDIEGKIRCMWFL